MTLTSQAYDTDREFVVVVFLLHEIREERIGAVLIGDEAEVLPGQNHLSEAVDASGIRNLHSRVHPGVRLRWGRGGIDQYVLRALRRPPVDEHRGRNRRSGGVFGLIGTGEIDVLHAATEEISLPGNGHPLRQVAGLAAFAAPFVFTRAEAVRFVVALRVRGLDAVRRGVDRRVLHDPRGLDPGTKRAADAIAYRVVVLRGDAGLGGRVIAAADELAVRPLLQEEVLSWGHGQKLDGELGSQRIAACTDGHQR